MSMRTLFSAALAVVLWAVPASAQMEICNKTAAPFSIAIAYETSSDVVSQGWWTVDPDQCQNVIETELDRQYYYHYVISRALNVEWAGTFNFCTNDDPTFRINGANDCEQRSYRTTGFRQTDVATSKAYTLTISMGPQQAAAQPPKIEAIPATQPQTAAATPSAPAAPAAAMTEEQVKNSQVYKKFKPVGRQIKKLIEAADGNTPEGSEQSMMYLAVQMNAIDLMQKMQEGKVSEAQADGLITQLAGMMEDGKLTKDEAEPWIVALKAVTESAK